ncbi:hypothetical protein LSH36_9g01043 [Paralvinella palmiformis]|uniref:Uncharacterized protein n=1 Tax=Paralvinella palmiformis TaxID=53620 RepID=A0AAD9KFE2_9ANNE|nr:hypothetical protein LSH36_9g01043 [Paralvinella palmiformis]
MKAFSPPPMKRKERNSPLICHSNGGVAIMVDSPLRAISGHKLQVFKPIPWDPAWIGKSDYWELDQSRTNCSVTDSSCYMSISDPVDICEDFQSCNLETCSNMTRQNIPCLGNDVTNYLRINYTCIEAPTTTPVNTAPNEDISTKTGTVTKQLASIFGSHKREEDVVEDRKLGENDDHPKDYNEPETLNNTRYVTMDSFADKVAPSDVKNPTVVSSFMGSDVLDNSVYVSADQNVAIGTHQLDSAVGRQSLNDDTELVENIYYTSADFRLVLPRLGRISATPSAARPKQVRIATDRVYDVVRDRGSEPLENALTPHDSRYREEPFTSSDAGGVLKASPNEQLSKDTSWEEVWRKINKTNLAENREPFQNYEVLDPYRKGWKLPRL